MLPVVQLCRAYAEYSTDKTLANYLFVYLIK